MIHTIFWTGVACLLCVFIYIGYWFAQEEYKAIKKYYPELTFWEYFILHDKLRITPDGE